MLLAYGLKQIFIAAGVKPAEEWQETISYAKEEGFCSEDYDIKRRHWYTQC